jgi:DNA repair protein RadB
MVGGDILKYGSKCLIELQMAPNNKRRAVLKKHRSMPEEKSVVFEIKEKGLKLVKQSRGFKLF